MSTAVEIVIVVAAFFVSLALISMLRLLIPKGEVWKSIRWGVFVQRTPLDEEQPFDEQSTEDKPYRKFP